jgi:hypothetical protein
MATLVRAITAGFAGGSRKRPGDEFTLPDGVKPGKWLEVVKVLPKKSKAELAGEAKEAAEAKEKADAEAAAKKNAELRNLAPPAGKAADDLT